MLSGKDAGDLQSIQMRCDPIVETAQMEKTHLRCSHQYAADNSQMRHVIDVLLHDDRNCASTLDYHRKSGFRGPLRGKQPLQLHALVRIVLLLRGEVDFRQSGMLEYGAQVAVDALPEEQVVEMRELPDEVQ